MIERLEHADNRFISYLASAVSPRMASVADAWSTYRHRNTCCSAEGELFARSSSGFLAGRKRKIIYTIIKKRCDDCRSIPGLRNYFINASVNGMRL
jgi:hypothetical protein